MQDYSFEDAWDVRKAIQEKLSEGREILKTASTQEDFDKSNAILNEVDELFVILKFYE